LDYGSGDGQRARVLQEQFPHARVVPYDLSYFSASTASGLQLSDLKGMFDVIILNQVLHHLICRDPVVWARGLADRLSPTGVVVVREDIWNGDSTHWRTLDEAHDKYHDGMNRPAFLTRNYLIRCMAEAGLMFLPAVPPDNYPIMRARGFRGQVYHFCRDVSKSMDTYYGTLKRLVANFQRLRDTVLNAQQRPDNYAPLYQEGAKPGPLPISYVSYMRDRDDKFFTQVDEVQKYGLTRFMGQADLRVPWESLPESEKQAYDEKFLLLAFATVANGRSDGVTMSVVLSHLNARPDSRATPLQRDRAQSAAIRLEMTGALRRSGKLYLPGPRYNEELALRTVYPDDPSRRKPPPSVPEPANDAHWMSSLGEEFRAHFRDRLQPGD